MLALTMFWIIVVGACIARPISDIRDYLFFTRKTLTPKSSGTLAGLSCLFAFEAVTAGAAFRITATRVPYVNLSQRAIIACAVVLTFGYTATDCRIYFVSVLIVHHK